MEGVREGELEESQTSGEAKLQRQTIERCNDKHLSFSLDGAKSKGKGVVNGWSGSVSVRVCVCVYAWVA